MSRAASLRDVAAAAVGTGREVVGAVEGALVLEKDAGFGVVAHAGEPGRLARLEPAAGARVAEAVERQTLLFGIAGQTGDAPDAGVVIVPVVAGERSSGVRGALLWRFAVPLRPGPTERRLLELVADECARALARARRHDELAEGPAPSRRDELLASECLAVLAHELRNPLAPLRLAVGALRHELEEGRASERLLGVMERQTITLTRLVDDLLDVARIRRGQAGLRRECLDARTVVWRAVDVVRGSAAGRRQSLEVLVPAHPLPVSADPVRLEQVLVNLLGNAAKYTPDGGRISIRGEIDFGDVVLDVIDDGVGIDPVLLPRVFDLFVQGDRTPARSHGGLGVGLTVVRDLVELHGGRVEAHSEGLGRGARFRVRLPRARPDAGLPFDPAPPVVVRSPRLEGPRRILVVDDNLDVANTLMALLDSWGHEVRVAYTGPDALEAASGFLPQLVLLDIGLPRMDGYAVARELRRRLPEGTLLWALTGYAHAQDRERALAAGFDEHFTKPLPIETLAGLLG